MYMLCLNITTTELYFLFSYFYYEVYNELSREMYKMQRLLTVLRNVQQLFIKPKNIWNITPYVFKSGMVLVLYVYVQNINVHDLSK